MYLVTVEYAAPFKDRTHVAGSYESLQEAYAKSDEINDACLAFVVRTRVIGINHDTDVLVVADDPRPNTVYWYARDWFGAKAANKIPEPFSEYELDSNEGEAIRLNIDELIADPELSRDGAADVFVDGINSALEGL